MKVKKTVFVMGSSSGIGNSLVNYFLQKDWKVYAGTSHPNSLAINNPNLKIIPINLRDITSTEDLSSILGKNIKSSVDALVCVSGISEGGDFLNFTTEDWKSAMNINLLGPTLLSRYFISTAIKNFNSLSIVYISSLSAFKGGNKPQYTASKAALSGVSSSVSRKFGKNNIRSNIVVPGIVETNFISDWTDEKRKSVSKDIPLGRLALVHDVVNLIYFLASDESSYISNQIIHINVGDLI